jgi:hypothetical protein
MRIRIPVFILLSLSATFLSAQRVLYSPFISNQPEIGFHVIGKAGNYYWVQKSKRIFKTKKLGGSIGPRFNFEIYDDRMNSVNTIPFTVSNDVIKEYFVPGEEYLDQLLFLQTSTRVTVLLNRFAPDAMPAGRQGDIATISDTLTWFPANMKYDNFLLLRSQDKTKILLLGFETIADSFPKLHSFLYNKNWELLYKTVYANVNITQPCIQYDFIDYPLEHFSNSAIKIANNGEWLMTSPSRMNYNFLLFHFKGTNDEFSYKEIKLSAAATVEEVILYLDNAKQEASAGILSRIRYQSLKNVRITHYLLTDRKIDFDTSFRFNTLATHKTKNENIYEEYFMSVPGKGFLLLKEYGRPFLFGHGEPGKNHDESETDSIPVSSLVQVNKNEYTRYGNLAGSRNMFERGDLSMYYFPGTPDDSCWSGIINKEQTTELNSSYLSYVFLPGEDKLFFLYNGFFKNRNQYSNTTVLDQKGNALDEGVVYWKMNNTLVFQRARQISENELAIPYERNGRTGFAIIRL